MGDEPLDDPLIGRVIGDKLRVDALIGRGSMGVVYRARHLTLKSAVAVKIMRVHAQTDPKYAKRFKREAATAFRLDHPNVLRVIDFGQEPDGILYMAMDFIEGKNLLQTIATEYPLSTERITNIVSQILAGVAAAHDAGVIHRDLKPENVMLTRAKDDDGADIEIVKVCDFGVAKLVDEDEPEPSSGGERRTTSSMTTTLTKHGMTVGTPNYMAPEQALGQGADARSDVYAVGGLLFQILTGRTAFEGATPLQVMLKQIEEPAPSPSSIAKDIDAHLERVCLKALRKKPDRRYQSAREMRAVLKARSEESDSVEVADIRAPAARVSPPARPAARAAEPVDRVSARSSESGRRGSDVLRRRRVRTSKSDASAKGGVRGAPAPAASPTPARATVTIAIVALLLAVACATYGARWLASHP